MSLLITGFNSFGNLHVNPSEVIVNEIAEHSNIPGIDRIDSEVLPTEFDSAGKQIAALIYDRRPEYLLLLGVAEGEPGIRLERVALNLKDAAFPDNAGMHFSGTKVEEDGPAAYWSTLPNELMLYSLQKLGIPARISNHAGTYVCNHVFYKARYEIEKLGLNTKCGFVHIPLMKEQTTQGPGLPREVVLRAITECLAVITANFRDDSIV